MAKFENGDIVWAKLKGFPYWPGKLTEPKTDAKKPVKKNSKWVFFFGSENYAWVQDENLCDYNDTNKGKYIPEKRIPSGLPEAVKAADEAYAAAPKKVTKPRLPSIDSEIDTIFSDKKEIRTPQSSKKAAGVTSSSSKRLSGSIPASVPQTKKQKLIVRCPEKPKKTPFVWQDDDEEEEEESATSKKDIAHETSPSTDQESAAKSYTEIKQRSTIPTPSRIGFLGLGTIGSELVKNLLRSGHEITVWNRTPSKCKEFLSEGALKGNSPEEVVKACDITFCCVADPVAVREVVMGQCGVLSSINDNKGFVDLSTIDADTVNDIQEKISQNGGRYLTAPLIGSKAAAESGKLLVLASGDRSLYDDCYSCFEAISAKNIYMGEMAEQAMKMKLLINMLQGASLVALAETLALSEKVGINQDDVLQVLKCTNLASSLTLNKGTAMVMGSFDSHFALEHQQKDMRLSVQMADMADQPLHVSAAANEVFKKAKSRGYGEHDVAAVYRAVDM